MNQTIAAEQSMQMTLPSFQPLRYWTPRPEISSVVMRPDRSSVSALSEKGFCMKGRFIQSIGGTRMMIIAGKIIKSQAPKLPAVASFFSRLEIGVENKKARPSLNGSYCFTSDTSGLIKTENQYAVKV